MTLLSVLAAAVLVYLMLLFLDRIPWVTAPAKQNIAGVVAVLTIVAVIVWAVMSRF
jgi:hypothetical protein